MMHQLIDILMECPGCKGAGLRRYYGSNVGICQYCWGEKTLPLPKHLEGERS